MNLQSQFFSHQDLNLHVNIWHNQANKKSAVLALHGDCGRWLERAPLAENQTQTRWYCPEFLGHDKSEAPKELQYYNFTNCLTQLEHLVCELKLKHFILLGYSMGGRIALAYALKHSSKLSKLVLISASPGLENKSQRLARITSDEELANSLVKNGTKIFMNSWLKKPTIKSQQAIPKAILQPMLKRRYQNNALGLANSLRGLSLGQMPNLWPKLAKLKVRCDLISGENDKKFTEINSQMSYFLPDSIHKVIKNAGHAPHLEAFIYLTHQ